MSQTSRYSALHADPDGPGDARPTGLDIVEDEGQEGRLADQVMLITGYSPGGLGVDICARATPYWRDPKRCVDIDAHIAKAYALLFRICKRCLDHYSVLVLHILPSMQHQTSPTNESLHMIWRRRSCVHHRQRSPEKANCTAGHLRQLQAQSGQSRPVAA